MHLLEAILSGKSDALVSYYVCSTGQYSAYVHANEGTSLCNITAHGYIFNSFQQQWSSEHRGISYSTDNS